MKCKVDFLKIKKKSILESLLCQSVSDFPPKRQSLLICRHYVVVWLHCSSGWLCAGEMEEVTCCSVLYCPIEQSLPQTVACLVASSVPTVTEFEVYSVICQYVHSMPNK